MASYYPTSRAEIDVFSAPYGNMMMYLNPVSSTESGSFSKITPSSSINAQNGVEIQSMGDKNEMMFIPPTSDPMCFQTFTGMLNTRTSEIVDNSLPGEIQLNSRNQNLQGLSLSLGTQMSEAVNTPSFQYQYSNPGLSSVLSSHLPFSAENITRPMACKVDQESASKDIRNTDYFPYDMHEDGNHGIRFGAPNNPQYSINLYPNEEAGIASTILKSKFLKAAQELLDEVVNVQDALKRPESRKDQNSNKRDEGCKEPSEANDSSCSSRELSPTERQDLLNKLDKLHSMLDEIERRYKQYCHQMQILVSSYDVVAGVGAAKPYTSLALKTISRHFRCLRDAISGQIQATRKNLGEQDNGLQGSIPRLRYVDQKLRQQRALQQFGMMRHAWRPQRGLPETAVTILRAWLFEHFLHPYPKDSEKIMLARQAGLTKGQVANWFINARVRLWKPMVEDMYKEEFGDADINPRLSPESTPKMAREKSWESEDRREEIQENSTSMAHESHDSKNNVDHIGEVQDPGSSAAGLGFHMGSALGRNDLNHGFYSTNGTLINDQGHLMVTNPGYPIPEMGNFSVDNNQVSLALGLRHREGDNGTTVSTMGVSTSEYPYSNSHILNDYVT